MLEINRINNLVPIIPFGRAGEASEVAEAVYWLLSDRASYSTGTFINVSGGR